jgi:hypothetical protein
MQAFNVEGDRWGVTLYLGKLERLLSPDLIVRH